MIDRLHEIMMEHITRAKEFAELPLNGGNTLQEAAVIDKRKAEIKQRIEELRAERVMLYGK